MLRSPVVCLSVCLSSVALVHPTQVVEFSAIFLRHLVPWPSIDIQRKFHGDCPGGTPPPGELNTRGVVKYNDFNLSKAISETAQDMR